MNLTSYPHLVKQWHPTKNGELTPKQLTYGSNKKVWWRCHKGHSWETTPTKEQNHQEVDVLIVQDRGLLTMIFGSNS